MNKLLPIGSVVKIGATPSLLLIIGHGVLSEEEKTVLDYAAVVYPFGLGSDQDVLLFDRADIGEVLFTGYADERAEIFYGAIDKLIDEERLGHDVTLKEDYING